jgi:hypothetical protein
MNLYAIEKVQQLESELNAKKQLPHPEKPRRKPVFGPLAAGAGRTLRRVGEGLESWANPPLPDRDQHARRDTA